MVETWDLAEENAWAIAYLHLEAQATKRTTASCLHKMHAATKQSIVETFKVTMQ